MNIKITVRPCCGAYLARAMGRGITASSAEGAQSAARAVCRKLGVDPDLLEQVPSDAPVTRFTHSGEACTS